MTSPGIFLKLTIFVAIIGILVKLWRDLFVDSFRQNVFAIRDELFDYASNGNIAFNNPAYYDLRLAMNSVILYAEKITFARWLLALVVNKYSPDQVAINNWRRMMNSIANLAPEQREYITSVHMRFQAQIGQHMVFKSPLLLLALPVYVIESAVRSALNRAQEKFISKIKIDVIEIEAIKYRKLAEAA